MKQDKIYKRAACVLYMSKRGLCIAWATLLRGREFEVGDYQPGYVGSPLDGVEVLVHWIDFYNLRLTRQYVAYQLGWHRDT
jgi:hypothetical protein